MPHRLASIGRKQALKVVAVQSVVIIGLASIGSFWGLQIGGSLLVGGLIALLPQLLLIYKAFQHSGAQAARQVLRSFYLGEALKFFLTIVLFAFVFTTLPVHPSSCLIGFVAVVMIQWLAPLIVMTAEKSSD